MSGWNNISIQLVVNGKNKRRQRHKYDVMLLLNARLSLIEFRTDTVSVA